LAGRGKPVNEKKTIRIPLKGQKIFSGRKKEKCMGQKEEKGEG